MNEVGKSSGGSQSRVAAKARSFVQSIALTNVLLLKKVWVWPIIAAILLGTLGWFLRTAMEGTLRDEVREQLQTILNADVTALRIWLNSQEQIATAAAGDPDVKAAIQALSGIASDPGVSKAAIVAAEPTTKLRSQLTPFLEAHGFIGYIVLARDGMVIASFRDDAVGLTSPEENFSQLIEQVFAGKPSVSPPTKSLIVLPDANGQQRAGLPTMFAFAPVRGVDGSVIAALGLRLRPEDQFTKILQVAWSGKTGETYAFDKNGVMLSQSRFDDALKQIGLLTEDADSILNVHIRDPQVDMTRGKRPALKRAEQPLTAMAERAVQGGDGIDMEGYRDYRGVPVVGAWTWLKDYSFGVASEVDVSEAFQPLRLLQYFFWSMFALLFAAAAAIFAFTVFVARLNRQARHAALEAKQLGQYALDVKLGEGGMGVVYRAHHAMLQRPTAVKFLSVDKTNQQSIARFEREVQLTSQLMHPNTIAIYDYGRTPQDIFYYAMEFLEGLNLDELVKKFGAQSDGRVIFILRQICGSLAEAHGIGLIHRDIKPANVFLTARGGIYDFVKLLDFGLAKAVDTRSAATLTSAGTIVGTPLYLSPEAIEHPDQTDARSDLYAVGAIGYFLLTGNPLFDGQSVLEIIKHQAQTTPAPPSQRAKFPMSRELEAIILKCVAKQPSDRPQSARELAQALSVCKPLSPWTEAEAQTWWRQNMADVTSIADQSTAIHPALSATMVTPVGSFE